MNIAYFGSPEIAATALEHLLSHQDTDIIIKLVVTQPDKPAGKKLQLQQTKVKNVAIKANLPVFAKDLKSSLNELKERLIENTIELAIVYAYGAYIPKELLNIPRYGFVNIHFSLLPKYRGASPIAYPLILGDNVTGVTLFKLNNKLDAGEIIYQKKTEIQEAETRIQLEKRLTDLSLPLTIQYIDDLNKGISPPLQRQNEDQVTTTRQINKNDGFIGLNVLKKALQNKSLTTEEIPNILKEYKKIYPNLIDNAYLSNSARVLYNYYRGLHSWPGIWTLVSTSLGEKRLKITALSFKENKLSLDKVQLEGKTEVDFLIFNKAYNVFLLSQSKALGMVDI